MTNTMPLNSAGQERNRFDAVDILRALAIILMIIFHGAFDLTLFGFLKIDFRSDPFWWGFPRVIVFLFLFPMGQSMQLAHHKRIKWSSIRTRMIKLITCAAIISIGTYISFPGRWIYFGTLHCIATCSILILPFIDRPILSLLGAAAFLIPALCGFKWPWIQMGHASMDYIPALPWIGVVMLGVFSVKIKLHAIRVPDFPGKEFFLTLSRHSLAIYLLHQPILFSLTWCLKQLS